MSFPAKDHRLDAQDIVSFGYLCIEVSYLIAACKNLLLTSAQLYESGTGIERQPQGERDWVKRPNFHDTSIQMNEYERCTCWNPLIWEDGPI